MCEGDAVGGIAEVCEVDGCGSMGVCATEVRAVDELCSTLEMNGSGPCLIRHLRIFWHL